MPHPAFRRVVGPDPNNGIRGDKVRPSLFNDIYEALENTPTLDDLQTPVNLQGVLTSTGDLPDDGNTTGDAYLVNGVVWVWDGSQWTNQGSLTTGPQGDAAALRLKGTVATTGDLPASGNVVNDVWIVDADSHGYGWTMDHEWVDLGEMRGPQGPGGEDTDLRERVDPTVSGSNRQRIRVRGGAPEWVTNPVFDVTDYGATGVEAQNATAYLQAAIDGAEAAGGGTVFFPAGAYTYTALTVTEPNIIFQGVSREASYLRNVTGTGITLTGATGFRMEHLRMVNTAGHCLVVADSIAHMSVHDCIFQQVHDDYSILYANDGGAGTLVYIDCVWDHVETAHTLTATVPTFDLRGLAINRNRWVDMRPTYSGNYTWWIETTDASSYALDNTIEGINAEVTNGGLVMLKGARSTHLKDIGIYDLGTTTKDLIVFGSATVSATLRSKYSTVHNVQRYGGTIGGGLYDCKLDIAGDWSIITFIDCGTNSTPFLLNINSSRATILNGQVTVSNEDVVGAHKFGDADGLVIGYGGWDGPHLQLGAYHIWVDGTGDLRIKSGAPSSGTDGAVVGTQS